MEELKPGEFIVNADRSVSGRNPPGDFYGGVYFTHPPEKVAYFDKYVGGSYFDWLTEQGFTRLYPKSQGSEIKEEATPLLDILASAETARSPLPNSDAWRYTGKTFDRFAGFDVSSNTDTQAKAPRSFGVFKSPDIA